MRAPPTAEYQGVDVPGVEGFATAEVYTWLREAVERRETLYGQAATKSDALALHGRAPVYLVESPAGPCVVRRYHRGGGMRWLGDRHLRGVEPRPYREARASSDCLAKGIETPRVLAGCVYTAGLFYRAELVTEFVDGAVDLAALLFERPSLPEARRGALEAAGSLIQRMAAAGVRHPDLNASNILLRGSSFEPVLIDLDRARVIAKGRVDPGPMLERLERSLRKLAGREGRPLGREEWAALRRPIAGGRP